ncbi:hypothetical protein AOZ07_11445 [Glutamicibacter halophytocola]|uniref:hypothetical protein n=1 Tax=Glutamicibacter halophytocola TaxID=1933880 RepID=UPI0006D4BA21|nr:hypothetical protein [Glutamicibacter halophytocola]ALG29532.1 hypothetical protein AOZ07_11445 [Glutamicibacter halophytocola]
MATTINPRIAGLRAWADTSLERAAVELLIGFNGSHLMDGPWIRRGAPGLFWFDPDTAADESGHLSGGERRVLAVATSLVSPSRPVDLGDVMTGIDPNAFALVIQAMGQAYGLTATDNEKGA